jgi:nucleoside-diphosphate-sugar epimerase
VCCVQLAKRAGAIVIAAAGSAEKAARLRDLGADDTINYTDEDFAQAIYARYGKPARRGHRPRRRRGRQLHRRRYLDPQSAGAPRWRPAADLRRHRRL